MTSTTEKKMFSKLPEPHSEVSNTVQTKWHGASWCGTPHTQRIVSLTRQSHHTCTTVFQQPLSLRSCLNSNGPPTLRGPTPRSWSSQSRFGQSRSYEDGQSRSNFSGQNRFGQSRIWPKSDNKDGQSRFGQGGSQPNNLVGRDKNLLGDTKTFAGCTKTFFRQ